MSRAAHCANIGGRGSIPRFVAIRAFDSRGSRIMANDGRLRLVAARYLKRALLGAGIALVLWGGSRGSGVVEHYAARPPAVGSASQPLPGAVRAALDAALRATTRQVDGTVDTLLCDTSTALSQLLPILSPEQQLACALSVLDLRIVTTYQPPGQPPITRVTHTLPFVPTLVNVDSGLLPDVVVTAWASSTTDFTLDVKRVVGVTADLPMSLELVVNDPTNGGLPRQHIDLGFDARASKTPKSWHADITLGTAAAGDPTVTITPQTTPRSPGDSLAIFGGLFDGDPLSPQDPMGGSLNYAPMPATATIGLTLGTAADRVDLATPTPAVVDGTVELVDGQREQLITAHLDTIPATVGLAYAVGADDAHRTITYDASSVLSQLQVAYRDTLDGVPTAGVTAAAVDVPTHVVASQTGAKAGSLVTNGAFGRIEIGLANGDPVLGPASGDYVKMLTTPTLNSVAVRLDGVKGASVDATDKIVADLSLTDAGRLPLALFVDTPDLHATGTVDHLPNHMTLSADIAHQVVDYNATQGLDDILITASSPTPFLETADKLRLHLADVPASFTLTVSQTQLKIGPAVVSTTNDVTSTAPLGLVEVSVSDGPIIVPVGAGLELHGQGTQFRLGVRVHNFEHVAITQGLGQTHLQATAKSEPFSLFYADDDRTVSGTISDLPHVTDVTIQPPSGTNPGHVTLDDSASIGTLVARVDQVAPFLDRPGADPHIVSVTLTGIPASTELTIGSSDAATSFSADHPIAVIEGLLTSGPEGSDVRIPVTASDDGDGVLLRATPTEFAAFGRVHRLKNLEVATDPLHVKFSAEQSQVFHVDLGLDEPGDAYPQGSITGTVDEVPASFTLGQAADGSINWLASDHVAQLDLQGANIPDGVLGPLHAVSVHLEQLPALFTVDAQFPGEGDPEGAPTDIGPRSLDGTAFHNVTIGLTTQPTLAGLEPVPSDTNWLRVSESAAGDLRAQVSMHDLKSATYDDTPDAKDIGLHFTVDKPDRALVDVDVPTTDPAATMRLHVDTASQHATPDQQLARDMTVHLDTTSNETGMTYDASSSIDDVQLNVGLPGTIGARLHFADLPEQLQFCFSPGRGCNPFLAAKHYGLTIPTVMTMHAYTTGGDLDLSGRMCLPANELPLPPGVPDPNPPFDGSCPSDWANSVKFDHVRFSKLELELQSGDSVEKDEDGDPLEDDLTAVWLNSSEIHTGHGLLDDAGVLFTTNVTGEPTTINDEYVFNSRGATGFVADHFDFWMDSTGIPSFNWSGSLNCGDDDKLDPNIGFDVLDLPGVC